MASYIVRRHNALADGDRIVEIESLLVEWHNRGMTIRQMQDRLREEIQLDVSKSTIHRWLLKIESNEQVSHVVERILKYESR